MKYEGLLIAFPFWFLQDFRKLLTKYKGKKKGKELWTLFEDD